MLSSKIIESYYSIVVLPARCRCRCRLFSPGIHTHLTPPAIAHIQPPLSLSLSPRPLRFS